ncbi:MAG TPA: hypothetical protein VNW23_06360 [Opitutaceae bacterium]|nr:hypothetical protein [Opitutaceae bacterium]
MKTSLIAPALFVAMSATASVFHAQAVSPFARQMDMSGIACQADELLLRPCARLS